MLNSGNIGPIKGLTLEDIENNLKKHKGCDDFSNFQEFLQKAKGDREDQAYVTFKISLNSAQVIVKEQEELADSKEILSLKTENSLFSFFPTTGNKTTKNQQFRFGLTPLEAIEENLNEDLYVTKDYGAKNPQISQPNSPRLEFRYALSLRGRKIRLMSEERNKERRNSIKKYVKSPYCESLQISPSRFPAIKRNGKALGMLKSFSLEKKKKN